MKLLIIIFGLIIYQNISVASRLVQRTIACNKPFLKNGVVRTRQKGKVANYKCNPDFFLYGRPLTTCENGRWFGDVPLCISTGCKELEVPPQGFFESLHMSNSAIQLLCLPKYEIVGNSEVFCVDGEWDRSMGSCRLVNITEPLWCDFEGKYTCGWQNILTNQIKWIQTNSGRYGIGPQHDHTKQVKYEGFFMLLEGSGNNYGKRIARLVSPIYDSTVSADACFRFYCHKYGEKKGRLRVLVKEVGSEEENSIIEVGSNHSINTWVQFFGTIPRTKTNFQIIIEGTLDISQRTDIGIDDIEIVKLSDCTPQTEMYKDEEGGINSVQSCQNRCEFTSTTTEFAEARIARDINDSLSSIYKCECNTECFDLKNCCPDYESFCVFDEFGNMTENNDQIQTITSSGSTKVVLIPTTTIKSIREFSKETSTVSIIITSSTAVKKDDVSKDNVFKVIEPLEISTTDSTVKPNPTESDSRPVPTKEDISNVDNEFENISVSSSNKDVKLDKAIHKEPEITPPTSSKIYILCIVIGLFVFGCIVGLVVFINNHITKRLEPLNYKQNYNNKNTRSTNEEFSEIRFLTDDEHLDFSMASPNEDDI